MLASTLHQHSATEKAAAAAVAAMVMAAVMEVVEGKGLCLQTALPSEGFLRTSLMCLQCMVCCSLFLLLRLSARQVHRHRSRRGQLPRRLKVSPSSRIQWCTSFELLSRLRLEMHTLSGCSVSDRTSSAGQRDRLHSSQTQAAHVRALQEEERAAYILS